MRNAKLKALIFSMGESQRSIGLSAKIAESRLSHYINGRLELTRRERRSLARVLKINEAELDEQTAFTAVK